MIFILQALLERSCVNHVTLIIYHALFLSSQHLQLVRCVVYVFDASFVVCAVRAIHLYMDRMMYGA